MVDGVTVVDLAGGWVSEDRRIPWRRDTLVNYYSVGKAFVALLALRHVDAGLIALDDPSPRCGPSSPPAARRRPPCATRSAIARGCRRSGGRSPTKTSGTGSPCGRARRLPKRGGSPGTRHAYHTNTYGHLVGEIVRRGGGDTCARQLAASGPLGADVYFGVPAAEQHRCAEVSRRPRARRRRHRRLTGDAHEEMLSYFNPPGYSSIGVVNTSEWRVAEVPSTNGHGRRTDRTPVRRAPRTGPAAVGSAARHATRRSHRATARFCTRT